MKLLITILTFMLLSSGVKAHSLDWTYLCRTSSFSLFRTEVEVRNFKKLPYINASTFERDFDRVGSYTADVFFDGKKIRGQEKYYIKGALKPSTYIHLRHDTYSGSWNVEGVKYIINEKEFSEKTGSKWVTKRNVFCEPQ